MTGGKWPGIGAACLWLSVGWGGPADAGPSSRAVPQSQERSVTFQLDQPAPKEPGRDRRRVELTVELSGEPAGQQELAVIVEGPMLTRFMIPMASGEQPHSWRAKAMLNLDDADGSRPPADARPEWQDPQKNFQRVDVSFARLKGMRVTSFLRRSIYVTLEPGPEPLPAPPPVPAAPSQSPPPAASPVLPSPAAELAPLPGIEREPVAPVVDGVVTETDLPLPKPALPTIDYWQVVRQRVTARFGQRVKKRASAGLLRVQFRLYPDGVARIIFIERTSGNQQTDQAGLDSVIDAHPFPPFPSTVTDPYVDVHVEFRKNSR